MPPVEQYTEEIDSDIIAEQAYEELAAEMEGRKLPTRKKEDESPEPAQEAQKDDEVPEPAEEQEQEESEKEEAEGEASEEEKPKAKDDPSKSEDEVIREYAVKHSMTVAEAKADIEATQAVLKNYKTPEEIARALRNTQSAYDKLKNQTDSGAPKASVPGQNEAEDLKYIRGKIETHIKENSDQLVEEYRAMYPKKTEMMDDEVILEEVKVKFMEKAEDNYRKALQETAGKIKTQAQAKREEILAGLSKEDRAFLPDIKAILDRSADAQIVSETFDPMDVVRWAKGGAYDKAIKEAEERGYKRGQEEASIVGAKTGGGSKPRSGVSGAVGTLNNHQKARAVQMFSAEDGYTEEEAYNEFKDIYKDELKNNPNFVS